MGSDSTPLRPKTRSTTMRTINRASRSRLGPKVQEPAIIVGSFLDGPRADDDGVVGHPRNELQRLIQHHHFGRGNVHRR